MPPALRVRDVGAAPRAPCGVPQAAAVSAEHVGRRRVRLRQDAVDPRQRPPLPRRGRRAAAARTCAGRVVSRSRGRSPRRGQGPARAVLTGRSEQELDDASRHVRDGCARPPPPRRRRRASRVARRAGAPAGDLLGVVRVLPGTDRRGARVRRRPGHPARDPRRPAHRSPRRPQRPPCREGPASRRMAGRARG